MAEATLSGMMPMMNKVRCPLFAPVNLPVAADLLAAFALAAAKSLDKASLAVGSVGNVDQYFAMIAKDSHTAMYPTTSMTRLPICPV